jgi:putative membrane protein
MEEWYLVIKTIHIIAIISWMAGLLYLPRLYVYHTQAEPEGELDETLKIMERRLLKGIMNPAMIITFITGIFLITMLDLSQSGWFHMKVLLLVGLAASHGMMSVYRKKFFKGENVKSQRYFRFFNEVPTVLMIGIVTLAVIKPF